jgi:alpha-galactosidase
MPPDMLELGVTGQNGHSEGGLSLREQRTHFSLWCVVSSPLTLSFDLGNAPLMELMFPIITNTEVLAVSQSWFGHPGTLVDQDKDNAGQAWQIWAKPQSGGSMAVLLVNTAAGTTADLELRLSDYVDVSLKRQLNESPWLQFTSECQRFGTPPRLNK